MVVDDETSAVIFMISILEKLGYQVIAFKDPHVALSTLNEFVPDAIVVDFHMGDMDVLSFMEQLRSETRCGQQHPPVLVMTADLSSSAAESAIASGAQTVLQKPPTSAKVDLALKAAIIGDPIGT